MPSILLLLSLFGAVVCPPGHHPPHDEFGPSCYDCGGPGPDHEFPHCLTRTRHCHSDEVCQINYGGHHTEIKCHRGEDCTREVWHSWRTCSSGGAVVHDSCQLCCDDNTCLSNIVSYLTTGSSGPNNHMSVHCPSDCAIDNMAACLSSGHMCNDQQFCKVTFDRFNNRMHGTCVSNSQLQSCKSDAAAGRCDQSHDCTVSCCSDDQCVAGSFGSNTPSFWDLLKGNCVDQLIGQQCSALEATQHLCSDRLALRLCPQTCDLCSMFTGVTCQDTVINNGCPKLVTSEDICNNPLAMYTCPVTCNLCDALLDDMIKNTLTSHSTTTHAPEVTTVTSSGSGSVRCSDLANQSCDVLNAICPAIHCPDVCGQCDSAATSSATIESSTLITIESSTPIISETSTPTTIESSTPTTIESSTPTTIESSTPTIIESSTPTIIESSTPTTIESSTPTTIESSTPTTIESSTPTIIESSTPIISETSTPTIIESSTPTIIESSTPTIIESSTPIISETSTPIIPETSTPIIPETSTPIISETSTPIISEAFIEASTPITIEASAEVSMQTTTADSTTGYTDSSTNSFNCDRLESWTCSDLVTICSNFDCPEQCGPCGH